MNSLSSLGMALWQQNDVTVTAGYEKWLMIFCLIVAVSLFLNMVVTMVAALAAMKAIKQVTGLVQDLHGKATPIIQTTTEVINDLKPKIRTVSENVTQITYTVREKVDEVGETVTQVNRTVSEANQRTRGQVDHVDRMVTEVLATTEDLAHTVSHGIRVPVKQLAGMVAGLRVGIETLIKNFTPKNGPGPGGTAL